MCTTTGRTVDVDPQTVDDLIEHYTETRAITERLCSTMETEDYVIQSMPDVSPTKWHLAHVTWFFETFILEPHDARYTPLNPHYHHLFNSYYNGIGTPFCRLRRGQLSRPTVREIYDYRHYVDDQMMHLMHRLGDEALETIRSMVILGMHHEQQHQELIAADIKHVLGTNPLRPALFSGPQESASEGVPVLAWLPYDVGIYEMGYTGAAFHFDNESPAHQVYLHAFELASRPVTNREYLAFVEDSGYQRHDLWLSLGWAVIRERATRAHEWERFDKPLHWFRADEGWRQYTLAGPRPLHLDEPVVHVSYFEADAFARWAGARLPTEAEWEVASADAAMTEGTFQDDWQFHPTPVSPTAPPDDLHQMFGDVWEWTSSAYSPYPGFKPWQGAIGEYNGKFMANQLVLRGGSCATPRKHVRPTYRNFFYASDQWQFTGFRLARDVS